MEGAVSADAGTVVIFHGAIGAWVRATLLLSGTQLRPGQGNAPLRSRLGKAETCSEKQRHVRKTRDVFGKSGETFRAARASERVER